MKIRKEKIALNSIWKKAQYMDIETILNIFQCPRKTGLLGIIISRKNDNLKNCVAFYGYAIKQNYRPGHIIPNKRPRPTLITEYFIVAIRFDNGTPRKKQIKIWE